MSEKISLDSSELRIENWFSKYSLIFNSQLFSVYIISFDQKSSPVYISWRNGCDR